MIRLLSTPHPFQIRDIPMLKLLHIYPVFSLRQIEYRPCSVVNLISMQHNQVPAWLQTRIIPMWCIQLYLAVLVRLHSIILRQVLHVFDRVCFTIFVLHGISRFLFTVQHGAFATPPVRDFTYSIFNSNSTSNISSLNRDFDLRPASSSESVPLTSGVPTQKVWCMEHYQNNQQMEDFLLSINVNNN